MSYPPISVMTEAGNNVICIEVRNRSDSITIDKIYIVIESDPDTGMYTIKNDDDVSRSYFYWRFKCLIEIPIVI